MTTIKQRVSDAYIGGGLFGSPSRDKQAAMILSMRIATLQEVVIGLDFLMKAVEGDDSIQAGRDFRFHYDQINNAENFRRVKGYYGIVTSRNNFVFDMKGMLEDINEEVNGSIFTPPDELIRELSGYLVEMRGILRRDHDYTPREFDELIGRDAEPDELRDESGESL